MNIYRSLLVFGIAASITPYGTTIFAQDLELDGTYRLVKRKLADGVVLTPPAVMGLSTYSKGNRNINVLWHAPDGKPVSVSTAATYKLTASEYIETPMFSLFHDSSSGQPPAYSIGGPTKTMPVKRQGKKIEFTPPNAPALVFDGDTLTATFEGVLTDYWEKTR